MCAICELLVHYYDGYALTAGKNLERVLRDARYPTAIRDVLLQLLQETDLKRQPTLTLEAAELTLMATGGEVNSHNGGIPRSATNFQG